MSTLSGSGTRNARRILRFGVFELDVRTGELRKHGVKLRLQGKPLQVLQALVERPGEVVTREELQRRLWPSDVFVDFDSGLNTAANRLRIALGDSADSPRYVETLNRAGYRFIAPVAVVGAPVTDHEAKAIEGPSSRARRRVNVFAGIAAASVLLAMAVAWNGLRAHSSVGYQFRQVTFR